MATPASVYFPKTSIGETTTIERAVDDKIVLVNQKAIPFLKVVSPSLNNLPVPCTEVKYEWLEDELPITSSKGGATAGTASRVTPTGSITTAATTFYVNYGEGEYFLTGYILQIGDEQVVITTKGTAADVVTVTRAYGGTTAATHAAGVTVEVVGRVHNEGGDATGDSYVVPTMPYNSTQIFQFEFDLTSTEQGIVRYGNVNRLEYLENKTLSHLMKLVERQLIYGRRVVRTTTSAIAATVGSFGGLMDSTAAYIYASNRNDLSSAAIDRDDVLDLLQEIFALVGPEYMPTHLMCNAWVKRKLNAMFEPYVRTDRMDKQGVYLVESILTDYGVIDLLLNHQCPAARAFFVHAPFVAVGPLSGSQFKTVKLAQTTGLADKWQLWGEYTAMIKNPKCHGEIYGISTSS